MPYDICFHKDEATYQGRMKYSPPACLAVKQTIKQWVYFIVYSSSCPNTHIIFPLCFNFFIKVTNPTNVKRNDFVNENLSHMIFTTQFGKVPELTFFYCWFLLNYLSSFFFLQITCPVKFMAFFFKTRNVF